MLCVVPASAPCHLRRRGQWCQSTTGRRLLMPYSQCVGGEIARLRGERREEKALTLGPRCDAALNNMPRVLLMRAREDGDPSKDEAKSAAAAAREAEVPHKQYKALDKGVIREGEDGESPKVGNLTPGRLIVALEEVGNRVRYTEGWVSKESKKGMPLLEFVQGGTRRDKEEQTPAIEAPEG